MVYDIGWYIRMHAHMGRPIQPYQVWYMYWVDCGIVVGRMRAYGTTRPTPAAYRTTSVIYWVYCGYHIYVPGTSFHMGF